MCEVHKTQEEIEAHRNYYNNIFLATKPERKPLNEQDIENKSLINYNSKGE